MILILPHPKVKLIKEGANRERAVLLYWSSYVKAIVVRLHYPIYVLNVNINIIKKEKKKVYIMVEIIGTEVKKV